MLITLVKSIGHMLLFCLPLFLLSVNVHTRNTKSELARPVMGTISSSNIVYRIERSCYVGNLCLHVYQGGGGGGGGGVLHYRDHTVLLTHI